MQWNDVAILTLEDEVGYTDNIQPICLAAGSQKYVDSVVTVAGWGTLREGGPQPASLMKVDVKVRVAAVFPIEADHWWVGVDERAVQAELRQLRPGGDHRPHALRQREGQGLLQRKSALQQ